MLETLAIVVVACNTVFVLQSSSARVHSVVVYNWRLNRLACLPSMLLTVVLMPSLSWCCRALRACITTLVYRIRGGKFRLAGVLGSVCDGAVGVHRSVMQASVYSAEAANWCWGLL